MFSIGQRDELLAIAGILDPKLTAIAISFDVPLMMAEFAVQCYLKTAIFEPCQK
ncbi:MULTISPECIES: hypothetical protein [unclassified Microcoleus]|uniref:hypothetical protein n=1 Tax=unclassified Microcoleus TaxID=2642155 RepID=UPI0025D0193E|nr:MULTISPECIES: hypothetical protein [unclassified Microcoleus]